MKLSEAIKHLKLMLENHGDLEINYLKTFSVNITYGGSTPHTSVTAIFDRELEMQHQLMRNFRNA